MTKQHTFFSVSALHLSLHLLSPLIPSCGFSACSIAWSLHLFHLVVSPPVPSRALSTYSILWFLCLFHRVLSPLIPSCDFSACSMACFLHLFHLVVSPPVPSHAVSTCSIVWFLHLFLQLLSLSLSVFLVISNNIILQFHFYKCSPIVILLHFSDHLECAVGGVCQYATHSTLKPVPALPR